MNIPKICILDYLLISIQILYGVDVQFEVKIEKFYIIYFLKLLTLFSIFKKN